ncbi:MAG TPA: hypothetical protein VK204_02430 [Nocardioidaceae bacterium]|jgi:hypothetical protein|nr:hypothetical protein [Nocardioidaceae bacterium]
MTDTLTDALAEGFVAAIAEHDSTALMRLLTPDVDFRGLTRVGYRFDITNADGRSTVEQQAYYRVDGGQLTYLRIVCSGYRPQSEAAS